MAWRYQPVFKDEAGERAFGLVEVYFNDDKTLKGWLTDLIRPIGNDLNDLRGELVHMLVDAHRWVPVDYDSLHAGMTFEYAMTDEQCERVARLCDRVSRMASANEDDDAQA